MATALSKKLDQLEPLILAQAGRLEPTVYGVIDRVDNINGELVPNIIRRWKGTIGDMVETDEEPTVLLVEKFEPAILLHRKYKAFYGGRGGMKSRFAQNTLVAEVHSAGSKVYVLRERMTALKQSIYSAIEKTIKVMGLGGFISKKSYWEIINGNGGALVFGGMANILDMKGSSNFKRFLMEEAEKTKQETIDVLGPTLREVKGAELWYLWNTGSSQDPMSKEFIIPYQAELDRDGFYMDDYHLIIKTTYKDNPWFKYDESLQQELEKDRQKVKRGIMSESRFRGIWDGMFNDDVATSVIKEDWFDSCIDAHKKLGIEPRGLKVAACDPSDIGTDPCGYAARIGNTFFDVDEIKAEDGNRKMDEACKRAIAFQCDSFGYDADGLGATLRDNVSLAFSGKATNIFAYKGSTEIHDPLAEFKSETAQLTNNTGTLLNKDVLDNKKAQNLIRLAERILKTHEAVVNGVYTDPDDIISFASYDEATKMGIKPNMMQKLKSEACKTPIKPGNTVKFYTKPEMRKGIPLPDGSRIIIPSPNLLDAVIVSTDKNATIVKTEWAPLPRRKTGVV